MFQLFVTEMKVFMDKKKKKEETPYTVALHLHFGAV
jgi:hypothetical protein